MSEPEYIDIDNDLFKEPDRRLKPDTAEEATLLAASGKLYFASKDERAKVKSTLKMVADGKRHPAYYQMWLDWAIKKNAGRPVISTVTICKMVKSVERYAKWQEEQDAMLSAAEDTISAGGPYPNGVTGFRYG